MPIALTTHGKLDALMLKASSASATQSDVEQAVDGVFAISGLDPRLATAFSVRSRIVSAELAYHQHNHAAVSERSIAIALNNLATRWQLPEYTQTSEAEVRKLHVAMIPFFPQFLTNDFAQRANGRKVGASIVRDGLSPLEATLLFSSLVHQKLTYPEYQMTPSEFAAVTASRHTGKPVPTVQDRRVAVRLALRTSASTGSLRDLLTQADMTMNDLGIYGGAQ